MSGRFEFHPLREAEPDGLLASADGAAVPGGKLELWLGPKRVGGRYFRADIRHGESAQRFLQGLYNRGPYPGMNWIEIFNIDLPEELEGSSDWESRLARYLRPLADAIPAGGHLMIEYEKPMWGGTFKGLLAGVPPAETPLGKLLAELGCGSSYKDWYFPEGGQEGGRKLQGNKAFVASRLRGPLDGL